MKQSNLLLILGLITLGACTGQKTPKSLATAWQSQHFSESSDLLREVASSNKAGMCLKDVFTTATLKKEVADYERKITGSPVRGEWRHLDLSTLPIPQANFLKKYGGEIGDLANPDGIDYEGCADLPCVMNRVYGKGDDHLSGYVHYIWYLKFGNYLSLDNKVPDQRSPTPGIYNGKLFKVTDYLYNETELYGLWRITHLLKEPYTSLTNLYEVQRIPRKENLEGYMTGVCGLASSAGNIRLQDGCLNVLNYNDNRGFLYIGVIHELTHMLDYLEGRQRKTGKFYRSYEQDYLDLVGFYKHEYTDNEGKLVSDWKLRENSKTIRGYAATSPAENFADTLAYYRQEGDEAKRKLDIKQLDWVSENYFHGDIYDKAGNRARLLKKYEALFASKILSKVMDCSSTQKSYQSSYFSQRDFAGATITPWMLKCISYEAENFAETLTAQVKTYEAEGCSSIENRDDQVAWNLAVKESLKAQFAIYVQEITNDPDYLEKVKDFNTALKDRLMANEALFQCYKGSTLTNMSACYNQKVVGIAKLAALDLKLPELQAEEMAQLYLNTHPYESVSEDLYASYRGILNAHESLITEESEAVWDMCLNMNHDDEQRHTGSIFSPRKGYLVSSFFNCLNTQLPTTIKDITRSLEYEGEKITHPVEEMIVLEFLQPRVVGILQTLHESAMEAESQELENHFAQVSGGIREFLLSDFSWVTSLNNSNQIGLSCRAQALTQVNFLPLFHLKREAFNDMIMSGPCNDIMSEPAFKTFFQNAKEELDREVFSKVESLLEKNATKRALSCKSTIPWKWESTRVIVRLPRKACMSLGWSDVENDTIRELVSDPLSKKYKMTNSDFRPKVMEVESRVRTKVEAKHF